MIHSTSSSHSQPGGIPPAARRSSTAPLPSAPPTLDNLDTTASTGLKAALAALPETRPEVVAKGKALAVDPNYPPRAIIEDIARLMVNAPDPSNLA